MSYGWGWRPYVPVARRRAQAMARMEKLRKKGVDIQPVRIEGRQIARTFWGRSWCEHLEKFSDYANRLPRGRTYVRNGSVCHLEIARGRIAAKVSGSSIYDVKITIKPLPKYKWKQVRESCAGQVGSLLELLQGKLSDRVMAVVTDRDRGLFPRPAEIDLSCSCPDWAVMCKHVAAAMYGIGARLDQKPDLLFILRGVDHQELVGEDAAKVVVARTRKTGGRRLAESELSEVFGIDVAPAGTTKATTDGRTGTGVATAADADADLPAVATAKRNGRTARSGRSRAARPVKATKRRPPATTTTTAKPVKARKARRTKTPKA